MVKFGDYNQDVKDLQNLLKILKVFPFIPTAYFGEGTQESIMRYQEQNNINITGQLNDLTLNLLNLEKNRTHLFFRPKSQINRAEAVVILTRSLKINLEKQNSCIFKDVICNSWYMPSVQYVVKEDIIQGRSKFLFEPNDFITKAEAAKIISISLLKQNNEVFSDDF